MLWNFTLVFHTNLVILNVNIEIMAKYPKWLGTLTYYFVSGCGFNSFSFKTCKMFI